MNTLVCPYLYPAEAYKPVRGQAAGKEGTWNPCSSPVTFKPWSLCNTWHNRVSARLLFVVHMRKCVWSLSWQALSKQCFLFYWNIIALQCCLSFWCVVKWISHMHMYIPSFLGFPPLHPPHPHPSRSSQSTKLSFLWFIAGFQGLSVLQTVVYVCRS